VYDIEGSFDKQILSFELDRPTVIFTEAWDPRVVEAACYLTRYARPVFLSAESEVKDVVSRHLGHVDPNRVEFALSESAFVVPSQREDLIEEFAQECVNASGCMGDIRDVQEARRVVSEPGRFGVFSARLGHADMVVGGVTHGAKDFFRPMIKLLANRPVVVETGFFVLPDDYPQGYFPHNIIIFGDVGVNATMTPEKLAHIAVGTCATARDLIPEEILPEIHGAIISYSNRGSDEGPSPERVRKAMELVPEILAERVRIGPRYGTIRITGEVKVSVALSQRSAELYGVAHDGWQGGTNVIIAPNLETGNLLYHLYAVRVPTAKKFPVIFGVHFRGIDMPMDCTPEDIRLAVKASILRLHRFGGWKRTQRDTFFRRYKVLAVNPGSTSTKIAVFEGEHEVFAKELQHTREELEPFAGQKITEQFAFRKATIEAALKESGLTPGELDAVAGRGGLVKPIPHGTYQVGEAMVRDLKVGVLGDHASNLGGLIASEIAGPAGKPAFIVDPVVVDEVQDRVKITGLKEIRRKIISHALNQIATARRYAQENETFYEKINVIVCHMGGGITVGAHHRGRYTDVNNGLDGEGPFTPERSGSLPVGQLLALCFSGKYTLAELKKLNKGAGGLVDLLGTSDLREVERRVGAGDGEAALVFEALAYQIAKWIASLVPAFDGEKVERVLLTGGMARSKALVERIEGHIAAMGCGVSVYPGENEMVALAKGALRVLSGKEPPREYA
jgi:butyrate kinase